MTELIAIITCSILLGFCLSLMVMTLLAKKKQQNDSTMHVQRIKKVQRKLDQALSMSSIQDKTPFHISLDQASRKTDLQMVHLKTRSYNSSTPPEKYTILNNLISQGMNKEEIAKILKISTVEASQLINLSSAAQSSS